MSFKGDLVQACIVSRPWAREGIMDWEWLGLSGEKEKCERCRRKPAAGARSFWGGPKLCEDCAEEYDREQGEKDENSGFFDL